MTTVDDLRVPPGNRLHALTGDLKGWHAVRVNDQPEAPSLVVLREGAHALLVRVEDLPQLRLRTPRQGLVTVGGSRYLRFAAGDGASIAFDDAAQSVSLLLPPDLFVPTTSTASSPDLPQVTPAGLGGFLNYDLSGQQASAGTSLGAIAEAGVFGQQTLGETPFDQDFC